MASSLYLWLFGYLFMVIRSLASQLMYTGIKVYRYTTK
jgi:hypothetical protein